MKVKLKGTPNLGDCKEREESFFIDIFENRGISIKDEKGKTLISFTPFLNGGSVWLADFSDIIMDEEIWGDKDGKFQLLRTNSSAVANVSTNRIIQWQEDSKKLEEIKRCFRILKGEE